MKEIKVLLLYPPEQSWPKTMVKPNGSLAYPYLAGALRDINVETYIYDACVGNEDDNIDNFYKSGSKLLSGMIRTGVSDERILEVASNYDAIGLTSIFSQQETQVLHCAKIIKKKFPEKIKIAKEQDWSTEYLSPIISVKVVNGVKAAINHINKYGSSHTDAIVTKNRKNAKKFLLNMKSSIAVLNASTQFADGGEFGFGAEVGISTGKLHPRGPIGLDQLTTYKYILKGNGQIRK